MPINYEKSAFMMGIYFNDAQYLRNKAQALGWSEDATRNAISASGLSLKEHFMRYGAFERSANGGYGINPSDYFNVDKYYEEKAGSSSASAKQNMMNSFQASNVDPVTHYSWYGFHEGYVPRPVNMVSKAYYSSIRPVSGDMNIDPLLYTSSRIDWNAYGAKNNTNTLYYTCAKTQPPEITGELGTLRNFRATTNVQDSAVDDAMRYLQRITGINFVKTTDQNRANIVFVASDHSHGTFGTSPVDESKNKAFITITPDRPNWLSGPGRNTLLHELAHAIGLKHGEMWLTSDDNGATRYPAGITKGHTIILSTNIIEPVWYYPTYSSDYYSPYDVMALNYLFGGDGLNMSKGLLYRGPRSLSAYDTSEDPADALHDPDLPSAAASSIAPDTGALLDEESYLQAKLDQMQETDPAYTKEQLVQDLDNAGLDAVSHYLLYGWSEGILLAETEQDGELVLVADYAPSGQPEVENQALPENDSPAQADTPSASPSDDTPSATNDAPPVPAEALLEIDLSCIPLLDVDPDLDAMLDMVSYMQAKLEQMQQDNPEYTGAELAQAFSEAGMDAFTHFLEYGHSEGIILAGVPQDDSVVFTAVFDAELAACASV